MSTASPAWAALKLPSIFGDHMVLQRDCELPVWGTAGAGETVAVRIGSQTRETTADEAGKWMVRFAPLRADGKPVKMEVKGNRGQSLRFRDVLVGDVWVCSGQSNMGMGVGAMLEKEAIVAEADQPGLRLFHIGRNVAFSPADDLPGQWVVSTPETIFAGHEKGFSAIGLRFGAALHRHTGVPVGMIQSAVGGTRIQSWSSLEMLRSLKALPDTQKRLKSFLKKQETLPERQREYETVALPRWERENEAARKARQEQTEAWKAEVEAARKAGQPEPGRPTPGQRPPRPLSPDQEFFESSVLFNGMIAPLIPYGIRGILWYQGEANAYPALAKEYGALLSGLVSDWRQRWGQGAFPFLWVQLPNRNGKQPEGWSLIRDAQRRALALPGTGMVVALDAGDPDDLHPRYKKPIVERLLLAARAIAYEEPVVHSGPLPRTAQEKEGRVRLTFAHVGTGLVIGSGPDLPFETAARARTDALYGFEVAGEDQRYHPATAEITGERIVAGNPDVPKPRWVRYGWGQNPDPAPNLYNREGLPASPFVSEVAPE